MTIWYYASNSVCLGTRFCRLNMRLKYHCLFSFAGMLFFLKLNLLGHNFLFRKFTPQLCAAFGHWRTSRDRGSDREQLRGENFLRKLKESEIEKRVDTATGKKTLWTEVVWKVAFSCAIHHRIVFSFLCKLSAPLAGKHSQTCDCLRLTNCAPLKSVSSDLYQVFIFSCVPGMFT